MISDLYSRTITPHIFEALYNYDHLARPAKIKPLTATGMPEVSADFRTWTVRIQPGIYFADDPAFKGQQARDGGAGLCLRLPAHRRPGQQEPALELGRDLRLVGLDELRKEGLGAKKPFDYSRSIEGVRAMDRHTIQFKLKEPRPRFLSSIAGSDLLGAQAREVVEFYGDEIAAHPVGTGPFRLKQWRRSSLIVLERNPDYRDVRYDAEPAADDAEGQAILAQFKGRRLPMIDEVQISIINEAQPFWLSFLNGQLDAIAGQTGSVPGEFITQAMPNGKLAPFLAKRGVQAYRQRQLRQRPRLLQHGRPGRRRLHARKGRAAPGAEPGAGPRARDPHRPPRPGNSGAVAGVAEPFGYDPTFKSENSEYDPARAKALLDLYGYVDRDGDGWRELPDGKPLLIVRATQPEQINREFDTLWKKNLDAIGMRTTLPDRQWAEQLKARARRQAAGLVAGEFGRRPRRPGRLPALSRPAGRQPEPGAIQERRVRRHLRQDGALPDGPERLELFRQAKMIAAAYAPYKNTVHRISTDMLHPWVIGFRRPLFWQEWWHMVDIDMSKKPTK